jgi:rod shape-determining protein MreC
VSSGPDRYSTRRDTLAFIVCLLLSVAARVAPPAVQGSVAQAVSSTVLAPFLALQTRAEELGGARQRYQQVVLSRDSALVTAFRARALEDENARLRDLLALSARLPTSHIPAEVLRQASPVSGLVMVLSAGRDAGVTARAPVIAPGGIVGVVQRVSARTSVGLMVTHPDFRVSAMTEDGSIFGIVAPRGAEGPNSMLLELRGVPYGERLEPGTRIYTSGLGGAGGVYPRGIPVGEIVAIAEEREGWSRTYVVRPAVHPAGVSHVVVLTGVAPDLRDSFPEPAQ